MKKILKTLKIVVLASLLSVGFTYIYASWSEPTMSPPLGNVAAPVNVGSSIQTKQGGLVVSGGVASGGATTVPGDVCILVAGVIHCLSMTVPPPTPPPPPPPPPEWRCPAGFQWSGLSLDCYSLQTSSTANSLCHIPGSSELRCVVGPATVKGVSAVAAPTWR